MTPKQPSSGPDDEASSQQDPTTTGAADTDQPTVPQDPVENGKTNIVEVDKEIDRITRYLRGPTAFSA